MNTFDMCRKNLYDRSGIQESKRRDPEKVGIEIAGMQKQLKDVFALAEPRLIMGGIRYGSDWNHASLMEYIEKKLTQFKDTGNAEMLIDVVNLCVVEMRLKTHPSYHFEAEHRD